jgi:hypothetical protein
MKKVLCGMTAVIVAIVMVGCVTVNRPFLATSNPVGSKVGQATGTVYLGIWGNAQIGIQQAAKSAGITKISTVDVETEAVLGALIVNYKVTVTGE